MPMPTRFVATDDLILNKRRGRHEVGDICREKSGYEAVGLAVSDDYLCLVVWYVDVDLMWM